METEKAKLNQMIRYINIKSENVERTIRASYGGKMPLEDAQDQPTFRSTPTNVDSAPSTHRTKNRERKNNSSSPFKTPIHLKLGTDEEVEEEYQASTGGREENVVNENTRLTLVDKAVKRKGQNQNPVVFTARSSQSNAGNTVFESVQEADADMSILNDSQLSSTLEKWYTLNQAKDIRDKKAKEKAKDPEFSRKRTLKKRSKAEVAQSFNAGKTLKGKKLTKGKSQNQSAIAKTEKTSNEKEDENAGPTEKNLSILKQKLGVLSQDTLTELNCRLHANEEAEGKPLHPYIQEFLRRESFLKFPVKSKKYLRKELPAERDPNLKPNLFKIIKDAIGKDITKMTLPAVMNQPFTGIQKITEYLAYKHCLDRAASEKNRFLRLGLVVSTFFMEYSLFSAERKKPINPLLAETHEMFWEDARMISEQVSHHPPICATYLETKDYTLQGKKIKKRPKSSSPFLLQSIALSPSDSFSYSIVRRS